VNEERVSDQKMLQIKNEVMQYLRLLFFEGAGIFKAPAGVHDAHAVYSHFTLGRTVNIILLTLTFLA
jgi:hypothetical protein